MIKIKYNGRFGVILLTEYHASSIRLWRVILLRSDIRLTPSDIRFASFKANRIQEPSAQNLGSTEAASLQYHYRVSDNITPTKSE